jgi:2-hydroxy-3-keto-5-methylthiopentenyl-1-phosphate phosphatase
MKGHAVLVSDFDGTITSNDFYQLVMEQYMDSGAPDYWGWYGAGRITHFEAMKGIFSYTPTDAERLEELIVRTQPDPELGAAAECLRSNEWDLVVVSAGCTWYIDRVLAAAGVTATVHANPGRIEPGRGLVLELPRASPFFSQETGIDKAGVVRDALARYKSVAFAGDGPPDLDAALLVDGDLRFARGFLAGELTRRGQSFREFRRWRDVVRTIVKGCR